MPGLEIKTLRRENWPRVLERSFAAASLESARFSGDIALIGLKRVSAPLTRRVAGEKIVIADDGYSWLEIAPRGEHWWLTAMRNARGEIVQYYFDVTLENRLRPQGNSEFTDLFLDVVLLPDGRTELLDIDEMDEALKAGVISRGTYDLTLETAREILEAAPKRIQEIRVFCEECASRLSGIQTE